ncbi:hypothetical protein A8C56_17695 [Niabella ginsenosidivorans]|uniref:Uncharacterized protein n=1 Tax=Niabella ginsenosidivorans TaxID=1176587 RepID=A0A1A9I7R1_9BACT|nr:hypothetical protein [Niabella ginsenosidivorans]ANH82564.1 hypothetical protein A8C56_17695 [Niabella ginsenosidivorans]
MRFFDFFNGSGNKKAGTENTAWQNTPLEKEIEEQAGSFLQKYAARYAGLDFSVQSLEVLEALLEDASGFYNEMSPEQQQKIIEGGGAYLFEVARKNVGGTYYWYQKLSQPILVTGQPKFEASILAFRQVQNRLQNGKEDGIPVYFESYLENVKQHRSAIII